jgi:hypothetical protein
VFPHRSSHGLSLVSVQKRKQQKKGRNREDKRKKGCWKRRIEEWKEARGLAEKKRERIEERKEIVRRKE